MKKQSFTRNILIYPAAFILGLVLLVAFSPNFKKLQDLRAHHARLKQKLLLEEKRNYLLKKEFNGLSNDPGYIEKVAREKLGWCHPRETVYRFPTYSRYNNISGKHN